MGSSIHNPRTQNGSSQPRASRRVSRHPQTDANPTNGPILRTPPDPPPQTSYSLEIISQTVTLLRVITESDNHLMELDTESTKHTQHRIDHLGRSDRDHIEYTQYREDIDIETTSFTKREAYEAGQETGQQFTEQECREKHAYLTHCRRSHLFPNMSRTQKEAYEAAAMNRREYFEDRNFLPWSTAYREQQPTVRLPANAPEPSTVRRPAVSGPVPVSGQAVTNRPTVIRRGMRRR